MKKTTGSVKNSKEYKPHSRTVMRNILFHFLKKNVIVDKPVRKIWKISNFTLHHWVFINNKKWQYTVEMFEED